MVAELFAIAASLRVLKQHALDEDVDQLYVEVGCIEGFTPKKHASRREYTHVVEHCINFNLFIKN